MERLSIAVSGASGFLGANLVRHFSKKNEVLALTRSKHNWRLDSSVKTVQVDIRDREKIGEVVKRLKPDFMIHTAGYGGYYLENDVRNTITTNVIGSINILDACKDNTIVINTGSSMEYGIKDKPMAEEDDAEPYTTYAMTKALITNLVRAKASNAITLRLFSAYGYYDQKYRLIPYLLYSKIKGRKARLSSKNNVRDFIFVDDVVKAYDLAIHKYNKVENGTIFNVGSGRETRVIDLVNKIGVEAEWNASERKAESKRAGRAKIDKIRKELGWKPEYSLEKGLEMTKAWIEENIKAYDQENRKN